jgi:hypothetical protein
VERGGDAACQAALKKSTAARIGLTVFFQKTRDTRQADAEFVSDSQPCHPLRRQSKNLRRFLVFLRAVQWSQKSTSDLIEMVTAGPERAFFER